MKVIMMEPMKKAEVKEIGGFLADMQAIVDGPIELFCPFEHENVGIIVNEVGKLRGLPPNRFVFRGEELLDILAGTAFIVNIDPNEEDFTSLTDDQIERLMPKIDLGCIKC